MAGVFAHSTSLKVTIGAVLTEIASLTSIGGLELSADDVDVTAHDSADGYREFVQGLRDSGSFTVEGNYTGDTTHEALKTLFDSGDLVACEIVFPGTTGKWAFTAYVNGVSTDAPLDDKLGFSASFKVSGKPTLS